FGHRRAGVWGDVLQRGRGAGTGDNNGRVIHGSRFGEAFDHTADGGFLLADRNVEALHARAALIDDRVDADGRLARLAVADDELALTAGDRRYRGHRLE